MIPPKPTFNKSASDENIIIYKENVINNVYNRKSKKRYNRRGNN